MTGDQQSADNPRAEEFTELYSACQRRLYVYIVSLIGNPADAHDLLQETGLVLWQKFNQFQRGTHFLAWAREVARLRVLRYRRMHLHSALALEAQAVDALSRHWTGAEGSADELYGEALVDCVKTLTDGDRELIELRYSNGVSVQALAAQLSRSVNAVSHSLGRIRRLLRTCVEGTVRQKHPEQGSGE